MRCSNGFVKYIRRTTVMPDAAIAAYGIEGKLYLQRFYMSDDAFHHKQQSSKNHKAFHIIYVNDKTL